MVACEVNRDDPVIEDSPCLLVEIVSPSTEVIDRREKLAAYKRIVTLQAYLIVDQDRRRVERHWRDAEGMWWSADLSGSGRLPVPCRELELTLDDIYEDAGVPA